MAEHARLSPSSAERWLACPASVRMSAEVEERRDSVYAAEGTIAHALAEIEAAWACDLSSGAMTATRRAEWEQTTAAGLTEEQRDEIKVHARAYGQLIATKAAERPHTEVMLEQRVYPGVEHVFGTGDAVLFSPTHVEVVDFKYGKGVEVNANGNPQLMFYGLGGYELCGDVLGTTELIRVTIYQPRVNPEPVSVDYTPAELIAWRRDVAQPKADEALSLTAAFNPGEVQCRWCPAAGICRPRMEAATSEDFSSDPDVVSDEELDELLLRIPNIRGWCDAVETAALQKMYWDGHEFAQHKVALSAGRRSVVNHETAIRRLTAAGYDPDKVTRITTETLGKLEALVGKDKLPEVLGDALKRGEGKPGIVPMSDPKPAVTHSSRAADDFKDEP